MTPDLIQDEDWEMARIASLAHEIADALNMNADEIAEALTDWAIDWNTINGLVFQIAANQEFGAPLSCHMLSEIRKRGINPCANFSKERAILRYVQNARSRYPMILYRGTTHTEHNALESWTTDREIAEFYVERNNGGHVIEGKFAPDQILGTYRDGIGLECAREVIVIHR